MGEATPFGIVFRPAARTELEALRAFDQRQVTDAIRLQLNRDALVITRKRKPLPGVVARFEFEPPLWELKVGEFRIFYDVNEADRIVTVRAVRRKPPDKTTAKILQ